MIFESCTGCYEDAVRAEVNGANRIELCDNLMEGGTTPSYGNIKKAIENINLPINVIIRPRGGNFIYNSIEKEVMCLDIEICKSLGANAIVIGALTENREVDKDFIKHVKEISGDLNITFHMAFDEIVDKKLAIDELVELGVDRILTKGGDISALNNLDTLKELIEYANDRIIIIPGAGITKDNRDLVIEKTKAKEIHGTKIV
ncbi:copper homeostasis protein CutC [Clostridium sp.]|uniref:copper homeostasis protein CutC n=1 Tax=Clostridium sp. TaxID=1506 RepID=UPI0025C52C6C|nr:copper homeostasis protein CutC [Clostridium sp.]